MTPEELARQKIDAQLVQCGWKVQPYRQMNISAGLQLAVCHFPLSTGEADYMLYADGKAVIPLVPPSEDANDHSPVFCPP